MGYYTCYQLYIYEANGEPLENREDVIEDFRESCEAAFYALNEDGYYNEEAKWYGSDRDLARFSLLYPDLIFVLHGDGEESEDFWMLVMRNGRAYRRNAIMPRFDFNDVKQEGLLDEY